MNISTQQAIESWAGLYSANIRKPETETQYLELLEFMNHLTDHYNTNLEPHKGLWNLIAQYLYEYEQANEPKIPESEPRQILLFLMQQHNLKARDFKDQIDQSLLSKILSGKRKISQQAAKVFANRFKTSPALFL
jgi:HTH-type transcriptional regulator / antitoxin HigA